MSLEDKRSELVSLMGNEGFSLLRAEPQGHWLKPDWIEGCEFLSFAPDAGPPGSARLDFVLGRVVNPAPLLADLHSPNVQNAVPMGGGAMAELRFMGGRVAELDPCIVLEIPDSVSPEDALELSFLAANEASAMTFAFAENDRAWASRIPALSSFPGIRPASQRRDFALESVRVRVKAQPEWGLGEWLLEIGEGPGAAVVWGGNGAGKTLLARAAEARADFGFLHESQEIAERASAGDGGQEMRDWRLAMGYGDENGGLVVPYPILGAGEREMERLARCLLRSGPRMVLDCPLSGVSERHRHQGLEMIARACAARQALVAFRRGTDADLFERLCRAHGVPVAVSRMQPGQDMSVSVGSAQPFAPSPR